MRSIPMAIAWEAFRQRWWVLCAATLAANAISIALFAALAMHADIDPHEPAMVFLHVVLMQVTMFIVGSSVIVAQSDLSRLYTRPISAAAIASWRLLVMMLLVAGETIVSVALLNALFDLSWPLWGPALFLAAQLAAVQAALWLTEKSGWELFALTIILTISGMWFKSRYGLMFERPDHLWNGVSIAEALVLLLSCAIAFVIGIYGVARNRRGDTLRSVGLLAWLNRQMEKAPSSTAVFRKASQAQFWFEWRQKGLAIPIGLTFCLIVGLAMWALFSRDPRELYSAVVVSGAALFVLALIGALLMGNSGPSDGNYDMGPFLATRPMSSTSMAYAILRTALQSIVISWLIWFAVFAVMSLVLQANGTISGFGILSQEPWWVLPATLLGPWIIVSMGTSIGLFGRNLLLVKILAAALLLYIVGLLAIEYWVPNRVQVQLRQGLPIALGIALLLITVWAFIAAHRRALVNLITTIAAASNWVLLTAIIILARILRPDGPLSTDVLLSGLSALAVAPLAAAPLAHYWNRHR